MEEKKLAGVHTRRMFVKNISVVASGFSVAPSLLWKDDYNFLFERKVRVAAFGQGTGWPQVEKRIKYHPAVQCLNTYALPDHTGEQPQGFHQKLLRLKQDEKIEGVLLYMETTDWISLALNVMAAGLPLYVLAPPSDSLQETQKLALAQTPAQIVQWKLNPSLERTTNLYAGQSTEMGASSNRTMCNLEKKATPQFSNLSALTTNFGTECALIDSLPHTPLQQIQACLNKHIFHLLFYFGSPQERQTIQWIKGELAFHLMDKSQFLPNHEKDAQVIFHHTGSLELFVANLMETNSTVDAAWNAFTHVSLPQWAGRIMHASTGVASADRFTFLKLHQWMQILVLKEIILSAFPYFKAGGDLQLRYPKDYLTLSWDAASLRFIWPTDLNNWI